jgi:hypothetical protein
MAYDFTIVRQYTQIVDNLAFHQSRNNKNPFAIIYLPENHLLQDYYSKLNIERRETKDIIVPRAKLPVVFLEASMITTYRKLGLLPYNRITSSLQRRNIIIDLSYYVKKYEIMFTPVTYRGIHGNRIRNYIRDLIINVGPQYRIVLIYAIDLFGDFNPNYLNRKSQMLMMELEETPNLVDDMVLCTFDPEVKYRLLIKGEEFNKNRLVTYFRALKHLKLKKEIKRELKEEVKGEPI